VSGVLGRWRADQSDGVWTLPRLLGCAPKLRFVEGQIGAIEYNSLNPLVYHTGTGEVLQPIQAPSPTDDHWYDLRDVCGSWPHLQYRSLGTDSDVCSEDSDLDMDPGVRSEDSDLDTDPGVRSGDSWPVSGNTVREGWVKDPEGKHRLWLPFEWRTFDGDWFYEINTLRLNPPRGKPQIIIMF